MASVRITRVRPSDCLPAESAAKTKEYLLEGEEGELPLEVEFFCTACLYLTGQSPEISP